MTPKEIYDRKKRLAAERKLRNEEAAIMSGNRVEGDILLAAAVVALEGIADALQAIAKQNAE